MKISAIGCILMDYLYTGISFTGEEIRPFLSKEDGDGGIVPGGLVFTRELEKFSGRKYDEIIRIITGGREAERMNIGGPAVVSMIHAKQVLQDKVRIKFYGATGKDQTSENLKQMLLKTPVSDEYLEEFDAPGPFTHVLSDPNFHGHGERSFINHLGAALQLEEPGRDFFDSTIIVFGGTALLPGIHGNLDLYLTKAKANRSFTVIHTVYDFIHHKQQPGRVWPLLKSENYPLADLLIMDREEACRISGKEDEGEALLWFRDQGCGAAVITCGADDIHLYCSGEKYRKEIHHTYPVSEAVSDAISDGKFKGDTTGCGDNFAGAMIASLAGQMISHPFQKPDMEEALARAVSAGGFACSYLGGTFFEEHPGQKSHMLELYYNLYKKQVNL